MAITLATWPRVLILMLLLILTGCSASASPAPVGSAIAYPAPIGSASAFPAPVGSAAGGGLLVVVNNGFRPCPTGLCAWQVEIDRSGAVRVGFVGEIKPGQQPVGVATLDASLTTRLSSLIDAADLQAIASRPSSAKCSHKMDIDGPEWRYKFFLSNAPVAELFGCRGVDIEAEPFRTLWVVVEKFYGSRWNAP